MTNFTAWYNGRTVEIQAITPADAREKALDFFKVRGKKSAWMLQIYAPGATQPCA